MTEETRNIAIEDDAPTEEERKTDHAPLVEAQRINDDDLSAEERQAARASLLDSVERGACSSGEYLVALIAFFFGGDLDAIARMHTAREGHPIYNHSLLAALDAFYATEGRTSSLPIFAAFYASLRLPDPSLPGMDDAALSMVMAGVTATIPGMAGEVKN
jgi:hypothetical protein